MADEPMWMVRAGEGAQFASEFIEGGMVAIGWEEVGPVPAEAAGRGCSREFRVRTRSTADSRRRTLLARSTVSSVKWRWVTG